MEREIAMAEISEADWKLFKKITERALEKYCEQSLAEFKKIAENTEISVHERYRLHYQAVRERDKNLAYMFDRLSRSNAHFQLTLLRRAELVDEDLLAQLSENFEQQTNPNKFK
jgi:hypothetical protein